MARSLQQAANMIFRWERCDISMCATDAATILTEDPIIQPEGPISATQSHTHFQDLPADLVYSIFITSHQTDPKNFGTTASHVCRAWRICALGIPILWSGLVFGTIQPWIEKNHTWIQRSSQAPLEIAIWPFPFWKNFTKRLRMIMDLILPQAHRWKKLRISLTLEKIARFFLEELVAVNAPLLEEFSVYGSSDLRRDFKCHCRPFKSGSPELRSLTISIVQFDWLSSLQPKLEVIKLTLAHPLDPSSLPQILTIYPSLRRLEITQHTYEHPSANPTTTSRSKITHLSLHTLDVPVDVLDEIVANAELPALVHLRLPNTYNPSPRSIARLQRSSKPERLTIWHERQGEELDQLLNSFHPVRSLRAVGFEAIRFRQSLGNIVPPSVQELTFKGCDGFVDGDFRGLVESRMGVEGVAPLTRLQVDDLTIDVGEG